MQFVSILPEPYRLPCIKPVFKEIAHSWERWVAIGIKIISLFCLGRRRICWRQCTSGPTCNAYAWATVHGVLLCFQLWASSWLADTLALLYRYQLRQALLDLMIAVQEDPVFVTSTVTTTTIANTANLSLERTRSTVLFVEDVLLI